MTLKPKPNLTYRQRGSVVVYTAVTLLAILISATIAIEMGRIYGVNRQLQKMAAMAALDAVRDASRCSRLVAPSQTDLMDRVRSSLDRNGVLDEMRQIDVEAGVIGFETGTSRRFLQPSSLSEATAVRVTLRRDFPALLTGLLPKQTSLMVASATADQPMSGAFTVGSGLVNLNGGLLNAALGGLVGGNLNLSAVDYNGLAGVNVTLQQLATALNVNVQDLSNPLALQANLPVLSDSLRGLASSLSGTANSTVINLLNGLATAAASNRGTSALENVLGSYDLTGASAPVVNLLDLIMNLAASTRLDPNGTGALVPLNLPNTAVNLPNIANTAVRLRVLEAPQPGRGRPGDPSAQASTAQVRLEMRTQVSAVSSILAALNILRPVLAASAPPINLGIDVDVAKATAFLDRIDCPRDGVNSGRPIAALSAKPAVASVLVGTFSGAPAAFPRIITGSSELLKVNVNVLLGLAKADVVLTLDRAVSTTVGSDREIPLPNTVIDFTTPPATTSDTSLTKSQVWIADGVPPAAAIAGRNPQTVSSTGNLNGAMSSLFSSLKITAGGASGAPTQLCLLLVCIPLGTVADAVLAPVLDVLRLALTSTTGLVDGLLDPLLNSLGIKLGSATVIMQSVTTSQPTVVSTCRPDLPASNAQGCPVAM